MGQVTTQFDVGDYVKPRHGGRRGFSFCVGQIRLLCKARGRWVIEYRPVFSTGTPGSWTDEKNLELVRRAVGARVPSVREFIDKGGAL